MPWQENSNFGNNNNNGGGFTSNGPKTNFRVGKVYGDGGYIDAGIWKTDKGYMTTLVIYQAIGKDPDTNRDSFEKKAPKEMPRLFLNKDGISILYHALAGKDPSTIGTVVVPQNRTNPESKKITVVGGANEVTVTIVAENGQRTFKLPAYTLNGMNVHAKFKDFVDILNKCREKALFAKFDDDDDTNDSTEVPFN